MSAIVCVSCHELKIFTIRDNNKPVTNCNYCKYNKGFFESHTANQRLDRFKKSGEILIEA